MTVSQSFDQLRLGLQTAKGLAWQAGANYGAVEHIGNKANAKPAEAKDAVSIGGQTESLVLARENFSGTVGQALATLNELGLPATETQPLRTALEGALREDDMGVFERMQIKTGWQGALQQLEQKATQDKNAVSPENRFQRSADAAGQAGTRQGRIERYVDTAIDVLTDLEMRHGNNETEIIAWQPAEPVTPATAAEAPKTTDPVAPAPPLSSEPIVHTQSAEQPPVNVATQPVWTPYSANPYAGWAGGGTASSGNAGAISSASTGWTPFTPSISGDVNALSDAVWGDRRKNESASPASSSLISSTGNVMSDFLLERGAFTPKEEDKEDEEG